MAKRTKEQNIPSIERRLTRICVPYGNVTFAYPFEVPGAYINVGKKILGNKIAELSLPDGEKTSFLLHAVYCGPQKFQAEPECVELRDKIMKLKYLWIFQKNLWVSEKHKSAHGVFVVYDEKGVGLSEELDVGELEKALKGGRKLKNRIRFSEDGKVGFAPRDTYYGGNHTYGGFAKDGFIIVSNGVKGAKRLAEVSCSEHFSSKKPYSWIVEPDKKPVQTLSAVGGCGCWLDFRGGFLVDFRYGCASGVLE